MSLALKLVLSPLLVAQAVATRRRALVLPEAEGQRRGRLGGADGPALRVLIAGDSSAAGVGVTHQRHAVAGHIARTLQRSLQQPIEWVLRARTGLTTREVHEMLKDEVPPSWPTGCSSAGWRAMWCSRRCRRSVVSRCCRSLCGA